MAIRITNNNYGGRVSISSRGLGGKFNYGVDPSYSSLLLNLYPGAAAAYSLRKLSNTYTGSAIRVRRSSDNIEQNIGFVNNQLDTASLLSFLGANSGFVSVWYDQSGNANNATQLTAAIQARIVNAGVITYQNGKPIIDFYGAGIFYTYTGVVATQNISIYIVQKRSPSGKSISVSNTSGGPGIEQSTDNNFYIQRVNGNNGFYSVAADATTTFCLLEGYTNPSGMSAYKNNVAYTLTGEASFGSTVTTFNSISNYNGSATSVGYAAEIIIYTNSQILNRAAIQSNINSYYTIY